MKEPSTSASRPSDDSRRPNLFLLGAWFGLATGTGELALLAIQELVLDRYLYYIGPHTVWMIPVADVAIFSALGLVLAGVRRLRPSWITFRTAVLILSFVGFTALAYFVDDKIHDAALLLLAAGAATQTARLAARHRETLLRLGRPAALAMAGLVAGGAVVSEAVPRLVERRALAALPEPPEGSPNVLLIIWDTVRAHDLSTYGYERETTPALTRLAERGVRFDLAASTASWTLPSHASMFTGLLPDDLSVGYTTPLDEAEPTLAEALRDGGWVTGGFVGNFGAAGWESGLARGFTRYEDFPVSPGQTFVSARLVRSFLKVQAFRDLIGFYDILGRKNAPAVTEGFLAWQERHAGRPFFAFLNYYDAHAPYLPPEPYATMFGPGRPADSDPLLIERMNNPGEWSSEALQAEVDAYDGAIRYLDDELDALLGELDRRGALENTIVIVTSDHGEEFGEHGMLGHGDFLWAPLIHVPLVVSLPGGPAAGTSVQAPVGLRHLPATLLDVLGRGAPGAVPGRSLRRFWTVPSATADSLETEPEVVVSQEEGLVSVLLGSYQYLREDDGTERLHDLSADPLGLTDLSDEEGYEPMLARFREIVTSG